MSRLAICTVLGVVGLVFACSSEDDDDDTSSGNTPGNGNNVPANPVNATPSAPTAAGTITSITLPGNVVVPVIDNGLGQRVAILPDGTVVTVLPDGSVVTGNQNSAPSDWDVSYQTEACQTISRGTQATGAMLEFVIDKSTSMNRDDFPSTNGATKWEATRDALVQAFPAMDSSLAVGEFFYPSAAHNGNQCLPGCADDEGGVPIAPLDDAQVAALQEGARDVENPTNIPGTPTHDALHVGLFRLQQALANPPAGFESASGYIVLMTDGMPTLALNCAPSYGCRELNGSPGGVNAEEWVEILTDIEATTAATGIKTFVVGVPGSEEDGDVPEINGQKDYDPRSMLSALAVAGRTATDGCTATGPNYCHIDMVQTDDFVSGLTAVIGQIVESVVSCEYPVPEVGIPNVFVNPDDVVMNYLPGGQEPAIALLRSDDGCATGSWYYNEDQTMITLCDGVCSAVRNDPLAEMQVFFGCLVPQ